MNRERVRIEKAVSDEFGGSYTVSVTVREGDFGELVEVVIRDASGVIVTRGQRMTSRTELRRWSASDLRSWIRASVQN